MAATEKTAKSPKSALYDAIISGGGLAGLSLGVPAGRARYENSLHRRARSQSRPAGFAHDRHFFRLA
jgi:hypothetical protein